MALIRPPITGDPQLDSWTDQLTRQINQGFLPGSGNGGGGSGPAGDNGNSPLYLYQRTLDETAPNRPTSVVYDLNVLDNPITSADEGWAGDIPLDTQGPYLWVTFRYVSVLAGTIVGAGTWDVPTLLGTPGEDAVAITMLVEATTPSTIGSDPAAWIDTSTLFRNDGGDPKALVATLYRDAIADSFTDHNTYSYQWFKNGVTPVIQQAQRTDTGVMERALLIGSQDISNNGDDAFTCEITF